MREHSTGIICCHYFDASKSSLTMLTECLCLALLVAVLAYLKVSSDSSYWRKRGVEYVKPIPFFGNGLDLALFRKSSGELLQDLYHSKELRNEKFGGIFLGTRPCFLVRDPDLIKKVMIKDFEYFSDRGFKYDKNVPLSAHLFNLNGWRWKALRVKLSPTFTSGKMRMMFPTMAECARRLERLVLEAAKEERVTEVKEPLAQFATDVIGTCAFGLRTNALEDGDCEFRSMGRRIFTASTWNGFKRALLVVAPALARFLGINFLDRDVSDFFESAVRETVRCRQESGETRNDFLQLLIELKNKGVVRDGEAGTPEHEQEPTETGEQVLEFTDELLAAQAFIFFIAGFETSSTTVSFALYELALNPDVQERLANEIRGALEGNAGVLTYDLLLEMKYLDMVVSETLRKYPPLANLLRKVVKPYQVEGTEVTLDPELRVFIPVYAIQRDPRYFPDPERFDPQRFTPEEKEKRHPMTYLPFGVGPRNCIGARFGLLQTKLGLCTLINRCVFEVCSETPVPAVLEPKGFVTMLKGGIMLRVRERQPIP